MIKTLQTILHNSTLGLSIMCCLYSNAGQAADCENGEAVARMVSVQGTVTRNQHPAALDDLICAGDVLRVGPFSRAALSMLATETIVRIDQESVLRLPPPTRREQSLLDLLKGALYLFSREPPALDIHTPFVNAAVEGTEFLVRATDERSFITVFEGHIVARNAQGQVPVGSSQTAVAQAGEAPRLLEVIRPEDAVQWALHYHPVLAALYDPQFVPAHFRQALGPLDYHNPAAVIARLDQLPAALQDDFYAVFRAAWLLATGQAEPARTALNAVLQTHPDNANALALTAIIALTRNDKAQALTLAQQAVAQAPQAAAAWLTLSYAQQAHFDLDAALASTRTASKHAPDNALVLARLSELWLAQGQLDQALHVAQQAAALNPDIARTQSVLGFAHLTRIDLPQARQAFERAIELDQTDPLPRLGLGLAKIRTGSLAAGREDIAIAVSLDPLNSLLRSYLGKAYFEEKRETLAGTQYQIAKELDKFDPTPWLYDALLKQAQNRPIEALQDSQQSIALNDNRAVYRSRLLLDEDLATRAASQGRIYRELGFEQLALNEGWKSLTADPGNFSSHRLLADTYSALPRHEIARVSELLQSQLRQPLNTTPLQPQLAETDLAILSGTGPSDSSFNEYTPLFVSDGLTVQANGVVGGNSLKGDDLVVSALQDNFAVSFGQFHYETDGFRENNDLERDIVNFFAQWRLSPDTSIQTEFRYSDSENGDLPLRFNPDNFSATERSSEQIDSVRVGFYHAVSTNFDIIGNFSYEDVTAGTSTPVQSVDVTSDGVSGELQSLFKSPTLNLIAGASFVDLERQDEIGFSGTLAAIPPITSDTDVKGGGAYFYSQINAADQLNFTVGLSSDFYDAEIFDKDQISPKLGLIWTPTDTTTVRAAAFRTLNRLPLTKQTLEPTQIAGFNQFFDDVDGTEAWRYGAAIEQKLTKDLYLGLEYSERDLTVPGILTTPEISVIHEDFEEAFGRAYLYWAPYTRWAFNAEYQYETFDRELMITGPGAFTELETQRILLGASYFHPAGFKANLTATHINQDGVFKEFVSPVEIDNVAGSDQFWVVDASLGYQFKNRLGSLSLTAKNLFDEDFRFQDTDPANPSIQPERLLLLKLNLLF